MELSGNQITDTGALALLHSSNATGQDWLDLGKNPLSLAVQNAVREWHAKREQESV